MASIRIKSNKPKSDADDKAFLELRKKMIKEQLVARNIKDKNILDAFLKVPRHLFVDEETQETVYQDMPVSIGCGQTISQPYIVAFMTEVLKIKKTDKVLEIGTGSGYQTAILAELSKEVFTIEIFEALGVKANNILQDLGYKNIYSICADGYKGWVDYAPYEAIIVTCSPTAIPQALLKQLSISGRMIIPVGKRMSQNLILLQKSNDDLIQQEILNVRFVPMIDKSGRKY